MMPKSRSNKFYAVSVGREGPKIYENWEECKEKVSRYPNAVHRSFTSRIEAEIWLSRQSPDYPPRVNHAQPIELVDTPRDFPTPEPYTPDIEDNPPTPVEITLSPDQQKVLSKVERGENVFFTGSAGTGKSVLLREIIRIRGGRGAGKLAITASTGIAAVNIGGSTLHSWAGVGLGQESVKAIVGKLYGKKDWKIVNRWRYVETLIIDEISMIDGHFFDKLEEVARTFRDNTVPFGGIQLILCGDFCQLPPVPGRDKKGEVVPPVFAFDAISWNKCITSSTTLTQVFRQRDQVFVDMLNNMRFGKLDMTTIQLFKNLSRKVEYTDGIEPTELFPTRAEVENANQFRLQQLPGIIYYYEAIDRQGVNADGELVSVATMERLLGRLVAPKLTKLKVGAQVMLIKNLVQGVLVNGSIGQITRFISSRDAVVEGFRIDEINWRGETYNKLEQLPKNALWPVVRFIDMVKETVIISAVFTVNNVLGTTEASREIVPLILAYALSVHKSQGQTLQRVKVDLRRTFEKGQAYVALSRATSMEYLEVHNFNAAKVLAHPRVLEWYGEHEPFRNEMDTEEAMVAYFNA